MKKSTKMIASLLAVLMMAALSAGCGKKAEEAGGSTGDATKKQKVVAYLNNSATVPFWNFIQDGVQEKCDEYGYKLVPYDSKAESSTQLKNAQNAITKGVDAIIISPTDSASCPAVLDEAEKAGVPVVIADVGTEKGTYLSYVSTPNEAGAQEVGKYVAEYISKNNLPKGPIAEVTIPLARINGQLRQKGFKAEMDKAGIKMGTVLQSATFTLDEGEKFAQNIVTGTPDLVGIWSHHSQATMGIVKALDNMGLSGKILVAAFDGDKDIVDYIKNGKVLVCGAQQPVEMGRQSVEALKVKFEGGTPEKEIPVPTLMLTKENIDELLPTVEKTVYTVKK